MSSRLADRSVASLLMLAVALVAIVGLLDYWTGAELSFSLFYLAPVALLACYASRGAAYLVGTLSAGVWLLANGLAGPEHRPPASIAIWNTGIRLGFFVIVGTLLASLKTAHERERALARTDSLTGVGNSRAFLEAGSLELLRSARLGYPISLVFLDIDDFKAINDRHGHAAGDAVLREVGRVLRDSLRATDLVGRVGGDEFAILLPDTDRDQAAWVAQKLRAVVATEAATTGERLSLSVGVVSFTSPPASIELAMKQADALMYEVKANGKNGIRYLAVPAQP